MPYAPDFRARKYCNGIQTSHHADGQIVQCRVSLVLANDITAPLAIKSLQGMGVKQVFDKDRVALVCDHFTPNKDIDSAEQVKVVRDFAHEMDITHYYEGGNVGVEHAILPEYGLVGPGDIIVGADVHLHLRWPRRVRHRSRQHGHRRGHGPGRDLVQGAETIRVSFTGRLPEHVGGKDLVLFTIAQTGVAEPSTRPWNSAARSSTVCPSRRA